MSVRGDKGETKVSVIYKKGERKRISPSVMFRWSDGRLVGQGFLKVDTG